MRSYHVTWVLSSLVVKCHQKSFKKKSPKSWCTQKFGKKLPKRMKTVSFITLYYVFALWVTLQGANEFQTRGPNQK